MAIKKKLLVSMEKNLQKDIEDKDKRTLKSKKKIKRHIAYPG